MSAKTSPSKWHKNWVEISWNHISQFLFRAGLVRSCRWGASVWNLELSLRTLNLNQQCDVRAPGGGWKGSHQQRRCLTRHSWLWDHGTLSFLLVSYSCPGSWSLLIWFYQPDTGALDILAVNSLLLKVVRISFCCLHPSSSLLLVIYHVALHYACLSLQPDCQLPKDWRMPYFPLSL